MARPSSISKDLLKKMYKEHWEGESIRQIAIKYGFSDSSVREKFDANGLKRRSRKEAMKAAYKLRPEKFSQLDNRKGFFTDDEVRKMFSRCIQDKISAGDIAKELGCDKSTINKNFSRLGLIIPKNIVNDMAHLRAAKGRESSTSHIGFLEKDVIKFLTDIGFHPKPQIAFGKYNSDIVIDNIIIEIFNNPHTPHKRKKELAKIRLYINRGFRVIYFCINHKVEYDYTNSLSLLEYEIKKSKSPYTMIRSKSYGCQPKAFRFDTI